MDEIEMALRDMASQPVAGAIDVAEVERGYRQRQRRRYQWTAAGAVAACAVGVFALAGSMGSPDTVSPNHPLPAGPGCLPPDVEFTSASSDQDSGLPVIPVHVGEAVSLTPQVVGDAADASISDLVLTLAVPGADPGTKVVGGVPAADVISTRADVAVGKASQLGKVSAPGRYPIVAYYDYTFTGGDCAQGQPGGSGTVTGIIGYAVATPS